MQRFAVLADVKHRQPRMPQVAEDEVVAAPQLQDTIFNTSLGGSSPSQGLPGRNRASSASIGVSAQFEQLLKEVAQQHVNELMDMRRRMMAMMALGDCSIDSDHTAPMERMESPRVTMGPIESWKRFREARDQVTFESSLELDSSEEVQKLDSNFARQESAMTARSNMSRQCTPKLTDQIMKHKHPLREVDAENVLKLWSDADSSFSAKSGNDGSRWGRCRMWLSSRGFETCMVCILLANVLWMAMHLQVYGDANREATEPSDGWVYTLVIGDVLFATTFAVEVCIRICVSGANFWRSWISYLDLVVGISCVLEIVFLLGSTEAFVDFDFALLRLIRVIKIVKSMKMFNITSILAPLHLLIKCLEACVGMLFWSFLLMSFVQCVAGIVVSELCYGFLKDTNNDPEARELVYQYYGTFTRSMLSMFEIMFANWGPACRVLVENVSEWFSVFFLVYRCILGYAVLNVVGAVFVQQALKTASSDDDLAFRQKERDIQAYNRKVKKLFQSIDGSGDGAISLDEFTKLVQSPKLKFWMSQLELEYHDLLSLFEFLDNGDGQITLMEFIEGAQRLRGGAKALDIWRMETKIEVLFEEVLQMMAHALPQGIEVSNVASVFQRSTFKHIRATTARSERSEWASEATIPASPANTPTTSPVRSPGTPGTGALSPARQSTRQSTVQSMSHILGQLGSVLKRDNVTNAES